MIQVTLRKGFIFSEVLLPFYLYDNLFLSSPKSTGQLYLAMPTFPGKDRGQHLLSPFCKQQDNFLLEDYIVGPMISKTFSNVCIEHFLLLLDVDTVKDQIFWRSLTQVVF